MGSARIYTSGKEWGGKRLPGRFRVLTNTASPQPQFTPSPSERDTGRCPMPGCLAGMLSSSTRSPPGSPSPTPLLVVHLAQSSRTGPGCLHFLRGVRLGPINYDLKGAIPFRTSVLPTLKSHQERIPRVLEQLLPLRWWSFVWQLLASLIPLPFCTPASSLLVALVQ